MTAFALHWLLRSACSRLRDLALLLTLRRTKLPLLLLQLRAPQLFLARNLLDGFGGLAMPLFGLLNSQTLYCHGSNIGAVVGARSVPDSRCVPLHYFFVGSS